MVVRAGFLIPPTRDHPRRGRSGTTRRLRRECLWNTGGSRIAGRPRGGAAPTAHHHRQPALRNHKPRVPRRTPGGTHECVPYGKTKIKTPPAGWRWRGPVGTIPLWLSAPGGGFAHLLTIRLILYNLLETIYLKRRLYLFFSQDVRWKGKCRRPKPTHRPRPRDFPRAASEEAFLTIYRGIRARGAPCPAARIRPSSLLLTPISAPSLRPSAPRLRPNGGEARGRTRAFFRRISGRTARSAPEKRGASRP